MSLKNKVGVYWFAIVMFIFCFMANVYDDKVNVIDIPFMKLDYPPLYVIIFFSLLVLVGAMIVWKNIYIDYIVLLLFVRLMVQVFQLIYVKPGNDCTTQLITSVLCILAYIIAVNYTQDSKLCYKLWLVIFFIICVQVMLEAFFGKYNFFTYTYTYKDNFAIPIGASNAITTKIIPIYAFIMCNENKRMPQIFYTILLFLTVALTKSRSGIIISLIILAIVTIWKGKLNLKKIIFFILFLIFLGVGFIVFTSTSVIGEYMFSTSLSTVDGRELLWKNGLDMFWNHPFLGNGFTQEVMDKNPHNFVINILMRSGLVGVFIFIFILLLIINRLKNYTKDVYIRGCICFALCMIGQGLVEIVLFTYKHDCMFWFVLGCAVCRVKYLKDVHNGGNIIF